MGTPPAIFEPSGITDIISTPQAMTMSSIPEPIIAAANDVAFAEDTTGAAAGAAAAAASTRRGGTQGVARSQASQLDKGLE